MESLRTQTAIPFSFCQLQLSHADAIFAKALACEKQDPDAAILLYAEVAKMDVPNAPKAQYRCAVLLYDKVDKLSGENEIFDTKNRAASYFQEAADNGILKANLKLGHIYTFGVGVEQNVQIALECYTKASEKYPTAFMEIGRLYSMAFGGNQLEIKDYAKAYDNFKLAYDGGILYAAAYLGRCFEFGRGVDKDPAQARKYFETAAPYSHLAASRMGDCYRKGDFGISVNLVEAARFYKLAKDLGFHGTEQRFLSCLVEIKDLVRGPF